MILSKILYFEHSHALAPEEELNTYMAETKIIMLSYTFRDENILNLNEFGRNCCQVSIYLIQIKKLKNMVAMGSAGFSCI